MAVHSENVITPKANSALQIKFLGFGVRNNNGLHNGVGVEETSIDQSTGLVDTHIRIILYM